MGGLYSHRFRNPARKGGRGRPPLQLDWDGCEICRRAYTYRHTRYDTRWLSLYIRFPSPGRRGVGDAAPYGVVFDLSRPLTPPGSIRPRGVKRRKSQKGGWLHKTPGAEKTKKPKRVTPGAPPHRITRRGGLSYRPSQSTSVKAARTASYCASSGAASNSKSAALSA